LTPIYNSFTVNDVAYTHDVEVSLANENIIWAGTGMYKNPELKFFVSINGGNTFKPTSIYKNKRLGFSTSIATHPVLDSTAFVLFSIPEKPKILRTNDLGNTWFDISGFGDNDSSSNGFPDVIVYTLLVHPEDTSVLWAGTEIGLFESLNSGGTWNYADNGLPAVSIFQLKVIDGQIIAGTHGRGIWTLDLQSVNIEPVNKNENVFNWKIYPNPVTDYFTVEINDDFISNEKKYKIFSQEGRLMKSGKITQNKFDVPFESFSKGVYIYQISDGDKVYEKKFVKK